MVAAPAAGQATPEELAGRILAAIAAEDGAEVRALMHPSAVAFARDERVSATVRSILGKTALGVAPGEDRGSMEVCVVRRVDPVSMFREE